MKVIKSPVIVALDYQDQAAVEELVAQLDPALCRVKVGKELFTHCGPEVVRYLVGLGFDVFLDLKFHDIPNTVAGAVKAAADLGVWMVNVHASGGARMMAAAREALEGYPQRPLLTAVTVLTSMDQQDLQEIGVNRLPEEQVSQLASLAKTSGRDGVVCSAVEASRLRAELGDELQLVTPGIRPLAADHGDQRRVATPLAAMASGSSFLVIGRPITGDSNPAQALSTINAELEGLA
jgi:orotidine-5'-phosphate decarboxylase